MTAVVGNRVLDETVAGLTRREFVIGGVSMAALLGACRDDEAAGTGRGAVADGFPRTIQTGHGAVTIPAEPRRVVTLGHEASVVLALGVVPVGMARETYDPSGIASYNRKPVEGKGSPSSTPMRPSPTNRSPPSGLTSSWPGPISTSTRSSIGSRRSRQW